MKKYILCYGDSNTHGYNPVNGFRYGENIRWTGRMAEILGEDYKIIEEGLNSRTTDLKPEGEPWRSGLYYLEPCIRTHMPLDLVILMLGSNDMKRQFAQTEETIGNNIRRLIRKIRQISSEKSEDGSPGRILLVSPPLISKDICRFGPDDEFGGMRAVELSGRLAPVYQRIAEEEGCDYLDAAKVTAAGVFDGLHLDEKGHEKLAVAMAEKIRSIYGEDSKIKSEYSDN